MHGEASALLPFGWAQWRSGPCLSDYHAVTESEHGPAEMVDSNVIPPSPRSNRRLS